MSQIYPGSTGAPAYAGSRPQSAPPSDTAPNDGTPGGDDTANDGSTGGGDTGGSGLISAGGSDGGITVNGFDTNGDGNSLVDVDANAPVNALDGVQVDVVTPDNLAEAHAPGLLDATVGDGGLVDGLGGIGVPSGGINVDALNGDTLVDANAPGLLDATVSATAD